MAFLVERTGQRIGCLLNPEGLTVQRVAGFARRSPLTGPLHAAQLADDPLLYTGGGSTVMTLDLLFDTSLGGSSPPAEDVRALTRPLWDLAENQVDGDGNGLPPLVRLLWGRFWNELGVITAVAERLEYFTAAGVPRRSWLRMRFRRVNQPDTLPARAAVVPDVDRMLAEVASQPLEKTQRAVEVTGGPNADRPSPSTPTRLDEIAWRYYGDAGLWRLVARFNDVIDPFRVAAGTLLQVPARLTAGARR